MNRNLAELTNNVYDILAIGGGIYGACIAWEASLCGLSVALVDKADFGWATSANSVKIMHGGLRYLQHLDFKRMRESSRERLAMMRIAPHLVHPLPVLIPTYGRGMKGKELISVAMALNDLISSDRNQLNDRQKHIPNGRAVSKQECQQLLPGFPSQELTGGAIFYDAQVYNSERLTLAFIRSSVQAGATVANYVEAIRFLQDGDRIAGVRAQDRLSGEQFDIRARTVVTASGPWTNQILDALKGQQGKSEVRFAKAINLVTRPLFKTYAVGIYSKGSDAAIDRRLLFVVPWRGLSVIGTFSQTCDCNLDDRVSKQDIHACIQEINQAYPLANLTVEDVTFVRGGLLPRTRSINGALLAKHPQIDEEFPGLISVVGDRYTTARDLAQKVVARAFKSWGKKPPRSLSSIVPIFGGRINQFEDFLQHAVNQPPYGLSKEVMRRLVYNYGCAYLDVLKYMDNSSNLRTRADALAVLKAEVLYGVCEEMAQKLSDIVFRRTELGSAGHPGDEALAICAKTMGAQMGWSSEKIEQELQEVRRMFAFGRE